MDYKRSGRVYLSCMSVGGALCALSLLTRLWMIGIAAIGIVVYGCIRYDKYCRCPQCHARLNTKGGLPRYCPNCGCQLDES